MVVVGDVGVVVVVAFVVVAFVVVVVVVVAVVVVVEESDSFGEIVLTNVKFFEFSKNNKLLMKLACLRLTPMERCNCHALKSLPLYTFEKIIQSKLNQNGNFLTQNCQQFVTPSLYSIYS